LTAIVVLPTPPLGLKTMTIWPRGLSPDATDAAADDAADAEASAELSMMPDRKSVV
jgi:hypothetical protein